MPYQSNKDLPKPVRDTLPEHAQTIYRNAYNNATKQYKDPKTRDNPEDTPEEVAHKVAWAAVKKEYEKNDTTGEWRKK